MNEVRVDAVDLYKRALKQIEAQELDAAATSLTEAIARDGTVAWYYFSLGEVLERQGNLPVAKKAYARALALNPMSSKYRQAVARISSDHGVAGSGAGAVPRPLASATEGGRTGGRQAAPPVAVVASLPAPTAEEGAQPQPIFATDMPDAAQAARSSRFSRFMRQGRPSADGATAVGSPAIAPATPAPPPFPAPPEPQEAPIEVPEMPAEAAEVPSEPQRLQMPALQMPARPAPPQSPAAAHAPDKPRILVVEDSEVFRTWYDGVLRARYHLSFATTARAALRALTTVEPALVVMDWQLDEDSGPSDGGADDLAQGATGLDLCSQIKRSAYRHVPVLMLTSKKGLINKTRGKLARADRYLTKPVTPETLHETILELLEEAAHPDMHPPLDED